MSDMRPSVSPQLIASVIESAPDRVRRRLDRTPHAAADWDWRFGDDAWLVDTGGESVKLPTEHVRSLDQISCTCLLSPSCFHVLACLTSLEISIVGGDANASTLAEESDSLGAETSAVEDNVARPTEKQRLAATRLAESVSQLMRVGVANAGVVLQSGLLRAVHQCRAEGLHRAAAVGLRVLAGASQLTRFTRKHRCPPMRGPLVGISSS